MRDKEQFCFWCRRHIVIDAGSKAWTDDQGNNSCEVRDTGEHTPYHLIR